MAEATQHALNNIEVVFRPMAIIEITLGENVEKEGKLSPKKPQHFEVKWTKYSFFCLLILRHGFSFTHFFVYASSSPKHCEINTHWKRRMKYGDTVSIPRKN